MLEFYVNHYNHLIFIIPALASITVGGGLVYFLREYDAPELKMMGFMLPILLAVALCGNFGANYFVNKHGEFTSVDKLEVTEVSVSDSLDSFKWILTSDEHLILALTRNSVEGLNQDDLYFAKKTIGERSITKLCLDSQCNEQLPLKDYVKFPKEKAERLLANKIIEGAGSFAILEMAATTLSLD